MAGVLATLLCAAPAAGRDAAQALLDAAISCANIVPEPHERAAVLVRIAEIERQTGKTSAPVTLSRAVELARQSKNGYGKSLALCEVARLRRSMGMEVLDVLREAEDAAESIQVKVGRGSVFFDVLKVAGQAALWGSLAAASPLAATRLPALESWTSLWYWLMTPPGERASVASSWIIFYYGMLYSMRRQDWEEEQKHLRDLARARTAIEWLAVDSERAIRVAGRIDDASLRGDTQVSLVRLAPSLDAPGISELALRAYETASALPGAEEEVLRARVRAVSAMLLVALEKTREPLARLRRDIAAVPDPARRVVLLSDLVLAAKSRDRALAMELFDEMLRSFYAIDVGSLQRELLGGREAMDLARSVPVPFDRIGTVLQMFGVLPQVFGEVFTLQPERAAEVCEDALKLLRSAPALPFGGFEQGSLAAVFELPLLRLLALHEPERAAALARQDGRPFAQAASFTEVGVALAPADPVRARELLDRAWERTQEHVTGITEKLGLDTSRQLRIALPGVNLSREATILDALRGFQLYGQVISVLSTANLQARIAAATKYAGGETSLARQRSVLAVDTLKLVPAWTMLILGPRLEASVVAGAYAVDREAGEKAAAQVRQRLIRPGLPRDPGLRKYVQAAQSQPAQSLRSMFAESTAAEVSLTDPVASIEFLIEAIENAPKGRVPALSAFDWTTLASRARLLQGIPPGGRDVPVPDAALAALAKRALGIAKEYPASANAIALTLAEVALLYHGR